MTITADPIFLWNGMPIEELSREELLKALRHVIVRLAEERAWYEKVRKVSAMLEEVRESR